MALAQRNPCGLSYSRTLEIIKEKVVGAGYNGRAEVMQGLMNDGFSYSEATAVTDQYFKVYGRLAETLKNKKPSITLTSQQKTEKRLRNLSIAYLNGEISGFPMSDADTIELEKIYAKVATADTPTLKEKYNEQASVFVQKFLPKYSDELFKTSVYARPLLSAVFFVKSLTSNLYAQVERSITDTLWDGKKLDFTSLYKFDGLANSQFVNVFKGGVPATSLYQSEQNVGSAKGRVEEFSLKGTDADGSAVKSGYYGVMKFLSKWSNRFNAAPDTRGIFSNAERHLYQLLKEKYRDMGKSDNDATQMALNDMELDDEATAVQMATAKFAELGLPVKHDNGKPTSEFKVAVAEYRRLHRDEDIWAKALQLSKNDFWKRNMTVRSQMGFGDYGVFGLKAQLLAGIRDKLERHAKTKALSAFNLYAFGFINGAANFAEDAIERFPLYGAAKWLTLQAKKGSVSDTELQNDIMRRQKDIVVKNMLTVGFFVAARMAEHLLCPDKENKTSSQEISKGFTQIGPCGIPVLVPPQMLAMYKAYKIMEQWATNDEEFFDTALNVLPVLVQSNEIGLGGAIDKLGKGITEFSVAKAQGNDVKVSEISGGLTKTVVGMGTDMANNFLPLPSRLMNETGTLVQRAKGETQRQQDLPFAINESGKPIGWLKSLEKVGVASMGNVSGVSEMMIAALGSNKNYAVDWQGRKVAQFRGSDIIGNGIQYTVADDIIATAGVKAPYLDRRVKIEVKSTKSKQVGFDNKIAKVDKEVRYMTDDEYFNVSVALGNFHREYFEKKSDKMIEVIQKDKPSARKEFVAVFKATQKAAIEAVEKKKTSSEEIFNYIKRNYKSERARQMSKTTFGEED